MRTRTTPTTPQTPRRGRDRHAATRRPVPRGEARVRAAGGPQDNALYACACGHAFDGSVSTHVSCPKCGADQAW